MSKTATVHAQQKWEYMEITRKTEGYLINELNQLGGVGWELVSVLYHRDVKSAMGSADAWTAFLKRPQGAQAREAPTEDKAAVAEPQPPPAEESGAETPDDTTEIFDFQE
jgi:hypothetical protein